MKNILIIPSWWPSKRSKSSGIFIYEQTLILARKNPDKNYFVFTWGHADSFISWRKLKWPTLGPVVTNRLSANLTVISIETSTFNTFLPSNGLFLLIKSLKLIARYFSSSKIEIDIIHAHVSFPGGYLAYKLAKKLSVPYIITEHMGPFPFDWMKRPTILSKIRKSINYADGVFVVNDVLSKQISEYFPEKRDFIKIHNFVDESRFSLSNNSCNQSDVISVISVGSLIPQKGFKELIDVLAQCQAFLPQKRLILNIVGEGPEHSVLKELAISSNLTVNFLGGLTNEQIASELKRNHVFALLSESETFGVVYLEALMSGLPVLTRNNGGCLDEHTQEFLFKMKKIDDQNIIELVRFLISVFSRHDIRKFALDNFSSDAHSIKLNKFLRNL